jgi:hypothetical protein
MRWKTIPDCPIPRNRTVKKFAWKPIQVCNNQTIWLEFYIEKQVAYYDNWENKYIWTLDSSIWKNRVPLKDHKLDLTRFKF